MRQVNAAPQQYRRCPAHLQEFSSSDTPPSAENVHAGTMREGSVNLGWRISVIKTGDCGRRSASSPVRALVIGMADMRLPHNSEVDF